MPLICRCLVSLALKHMSKMSTTVGADDLRPGHSERAVCVSRHSAWDVVEVCRPSAARLEFVVCLVEWRIASGARVDTLFRQMLVIFSGEWSFSSLFTQDAELFWNSTVLVTARRLGRLREDIPLLRTACHSWSDL
jgi:hypothetical protein